MASRVFLISNHQLIVWGLTRLLASQAANFELVQVASVLTLETEAAVLSASPDIVLLDLDMGPQEALKFICRLGATALPSKILVLTRSADITLQDQAVMSGARGLVDHSATPDMVLVALTKVHQGQLWIDRDATARVFGKLARGGQTALDTRKTDCWHTLTERERQIVIFLACHDGESGKAIARKLHISESTLRNHLTSVYDKLGVVNAHGLRAYTSRQRLGAPGV